MLILGKNVKERKDKGSPRSVEFQHKQLRSIFASGGKKMSELECGLCMGFLRP